MQIYTSTCFFVVVCYPPFSFDFFMLYNPVWFLIDVKIQAHEQLRAVLITLLEDLPSDSPILLFGTASAKLQDLPSSIFSARNTYAVLFQLQLFFVNFRSEWNFPDYIFNHVNITVMNWANHQMKIGLCFLTVWLKLLCQSHLIAWQKNPRSRGPFLNFLKLQKLLVAQRPLS